MEALLRRSMVNNEECITVGELVLNQSEHRLYIAELPIELGPTEYKLLDFFTRNPNRAYSRTQLLDNVWSGDTYIDERTVDVHIRRLRKTLEEQSPPGLNPHQYIETIRGTGYRFNTKNS